MKTAVSAKLAYKVKIPRGAKTVDVEVVTRSTLAFARPEGHRYAVGFAGREVKEVNFNARLNEKPENIYSVFYPTVARRVVRIDGVGMQTHVNLTYPSLSDWEASLEAFAAEGVKVMVTEMDVSALPSAWGLTAGEKRPAARVARFRRFELSAENPKTLVQPTAGTFANPILAGMSPDPSITRKGHDYYLANSSFSYYPGIPVWHSTDLVNWDFCGYCAARPSQLRLKEGVGLSAGVFAPDIKYNPHNDTFYLIVTVIGDRGNVIYKTKDPCLGWGEPIKVPVGGIDPSMFFVGSVVGLYATTKAE